jgi:hypothetical protein
MSIAFLGSSHVLSHGGEHKPVIHEESPKSTKEKKRPSAKETMDYYQLFLEKEHGVMEIQQDQKKLKKYFKDYGQIQKAMFKIQMELKNLSQSKDSLHQNSLKITKLSTRWKRLAMMEKKIINEKIKPLSEKILAKEAHLKTMILNLKNINKDNTHKNHSHSVENLIERKNQLIENLMMLMKDNHRDLNLKEEYMKNYFHQWKVLKKEIKEKKLFTINQHFFPLIELLMKNIEINSDITWLNEETEKIIEELYNISIQLKQLGYKEEKKVMDQAVKVVKPNTTKTSPSPREPTSKEKAKTLGQTPQKK